ncbi:uncharacterized protein LOC133717888 isoform X2 [Rosa rugosa]|uniref:uncharacterized protein LOC133717888 isoform X2 n=1 Tax=Rosa rugosa TaxID=74645 RepID=UPI002B40EB38|nr:uncharacterized protein LOC133717888 isoform X2 [Rosa rugosa]
MEGDDIGARKADDTIGRMLSSGSDSKRVSGSDSKISGSEAEVLPHAVSDSGGVSGSDSEISGSEAELLPHTVSDSDLDSGSDSKISGTDPDVVPLAPRGHGRSLGGSRLPNLVRHGARGLGHGTGGLVHITGDLGHVVGGIGHSAGGRGHGAGGRGHVAGGIGHSAGGRGHFAGGIGQGAGGTRPHCHRARPGFRWEVFNQLLFKIRCAPWFWTSSLSRITRIHRNDGVYAVQVQVKCSLIYMDFEGCSTSLMCCVEFVDFKSFGWRRYAKTCNPLQYDRPRKGLPCW